MKRSVIITFVMTLMFLSPVKAKAASEDACAIWICLPGGFPQGCSGAYSEFKHRIKKGRPPMPELSSCTTGPNGERANGRYELGYERYELCKEGYVLRESQQINQAKCYVERCAPEKYSQDNYYCDNYQATLRPKPNYVKMWVDGEYLGQYYYR